ncbi:MAG: DUF3467 domain-containing protein [Planctomycetia bacterium]|nr:DUF3467 domain-containing protein [Planctomycetia bacterium]
MAKSTANPPTDAPNGHDVPGTHRHIPIVDDSDVTVTYANFCRLAMLPEELALDFGLNMTGQGSNQQTVRTSQRIVINYYWAKRLVGILNAAVHQYESKFGPLEVDVNKRAAPHANPPG